MNTERRTSTAHLRICLVSSAYRPWPSGVGEHVHHLAAALRNRGHTAEILTTRYGDPAVPVEVGVTRLGRALILPANRSRFTLPVGWNLAGCVRRYLRDREFDVIHCHGIFPPELAYWAAIHTSRPVVVTFHTFGLRLPGPVSAGFRNIFRRLRHRVRARIAVSRAGRRWAERWFPGSYHIIPNGVDTGRYRPDAVIPPEAARLRPYLLFVGRLETRKGPDIALRALPLLLRQFPSLRLAVIGDGPLKSRCLHLATELGIGTRVEFPGRVDADRLPGWYAGAEAFVSPALGGEAMGIVLLEAMACSRPVAASAIPGYDEVVTHNHDGLLVNPGDPTALAEAVADLIGNPTRAHRLAEAGHEHALGYSWSNITTRVEAVYREVLD